MIRLDGPFFTDEYGRTCILRGVNLGGSSKVPTTPDGASHLPESFFDHRQVSFVGRPFPLEEADEHLERLKSWGLTFLRLLVTWEAIEHAGPGEYDEEYLDYLVQVVIKAGAHGFKLFIDPHQDVWSRFSGGDGAPGWTLEMVGMDLAHIVETGAAVVHCFSPALPAGSPYRRITRFWWFLNLSQNSSAVWRATALVSMISSSRYSDLPLSRRTPTALLIGV